MSKMTPEEKLKDIVATVKCPAKAMEVQGSEVVCTHPCVVGRKDLGPVSLGTIKSDIVNHCAGCAFKNKGKAKKPTFKTLKMDEYQQIVCPATENQVSLSETCAKCPYLNKQELRRVMEERGGDFEPTHVPCWFPHLDPKNIKAFLDEKVKKDHLKEVKEFAKKKKDRKAKTSA